MKFICKLFGHRFNYYIRNANENENMRFCVHCGLAQEYKPMTVASFLRPEKVWVNLVQRTRRGAMNYFKYCAFKV